MLKLTTVPWTVFIWIFGFKTQAKFRFLHSSWEVVIARRTGTTHSVLDYVVYRLFYVLLVSGVVVYKISQTHPIHFIFSIESWTVITGLLYAVLFLRQVLAHNRHRKPLWRRQKLPDQVEITGEVQKGGHFLFISKKISVLEHAPLTIYEKFVWITWDISAAISIGTFIAYHVGYLERRIPEARGLTNGIVVALKFVLTLLDIGVHTIPMRLGHMMFPLGFYGIFVLASFLYHEFQHIVRNEEKHIYKKDIWHPDQAMKIFYLIIVGHLIAFFLSWVRDFIISLVDLSRTTANEQRVRSQKRLARRRAMVPLYGPDGKLYRIFLDTSQEANHEDFIYMKGDEDDDADGEYSYRNKGKHWTELRFDDEKGPSDIPTERAFMSIASVLDIHANNSAASGRSGEELFEKPKPVLSSVISEVMATRKSKMHKEDFPPPAPVLTDVVEQAVATKKMQKEQHGPPPPPAPPLPTEDKKPKQPIVRKNLEDITATDLPSPPQNIPEIKIKSPKPKTAKVAPLPHPLEETTEKEEAPPKKQLKLKEGPPIEFIVGGPLNKSKSSKSKSRRSPQSPDGEGKKAPGGGIDEDALAAAYQRKQNAHLIRNKRVFQKSQALPLVASLSKKWFRRGSGSHPRYDPVPGGDGEGKKHGTHRRSLDSELEAERLRYERLHKDHKINRLAQAHPHYGPLRPAVPVIEKKKKKGLKKNLLRKPGGSAPLPEKKAMDIEIIHRRTDDEGSDTPPPQGILQDKEHHRILRKESLERRREGGKVNPTYDPMNTNPNQAMTFHYLGDNLTTRVNQSHNVPLKEAKKFRKHKGLSTLHSKEKGYLSEEGHERVESLVAFHPLIRYYEDTREEYQDYQFQDDTRFADDEADAPPPIVEKKDKKKLKKKKKSKDYY